MATPIDVWAIRGLDRGQKAPLSLIGGQWLPKGVTRWPTKDNTSYSIKLCSHFEVEKVVHFLPLIKRSKITSKGRRITLNRFYRWLTWLKSLLLRSCRSGKAHLVMEHPILFSNKNRCVRWLRRERNLNGLSPLERPFGLSRRRGLPISRQEMMWGKMDTRSKTSAYHGWSQIQNGHGFESRDSPRFFRNPC